MEPIGDVEVSRDNPAIEPLAFNRSNHRSKSYASHRALWCLSPDIFKQPESDVGHSARQSRRRFRERPRHPGNVAMSPFDRVIRSNGWRAHDHFVEDDAMGI